MTDSTMALKNRLAPVVSRLRGKSPLCPWGSALRALHPATWRVRPPPIDIKVVETAPGRHLLRFAGKHDFWFPLAMPRSAELWSEYLVTAWDHPCNAHYYLRHGVRLGREDLVLDCGACEGFFARQALDLGVRRVVCVEPNAEMLACLGLTFASEIADGRVTLLPNALGSLSGEARFAVAPGEAFSGRFDGSGECKVPVITLDQLAAEHGSPTMVKMDLEGSEYEALRGGVGLISGARPKLAITTYHYPWDYAVVSGLLLGTGYAHCRASSAIMRGGSAARPVMVHAWHDQFHV